MHNDSLELEVNDMIWIHKDQVFLKGIVKSISKDIFTCLTESSAIVHAKKNCIFRRNPSPQSYDPDRNDLMDTDVLNEPELLETLRLRFKHKEIYTYVQSTLLIVNPFQMMPEVYTQKVKDHYVNSIIKEGNNMRNQRPHIYAITANMIIELMESKNNQALLISGESGAGKTQTSKEAIRFITYYFGQQRKIQSSIVNKNQANISQQPKSTKLKENVNTQKKKNGSTEENKVQRALLVGNPILQAFGNAKTILNNNSSRFGKYLSICVDKENHIRSAQIYNYLLQKSRIISRADNQQNFHIFYQFLLGASLEEKAKYHLPNMPQNQNNFHFFKYLRSNSSNYISNPEVSFQSIKQSLEIIRQSSAFDFVCRVLSAVLYLGNLDPCQKEDEEYCKVQSEEIVQLVCELLCIDRIQFISSVTSYSIKIGIETLTKYFSVRQVQELLHSLSKTLYEKLFQWIVHSLNRVSAGGIQGQEVLKLGFLDIYGFEVLKQNSLEQVFINYTNERLHQIYLHKMFKDERLEFEQQQLLHKFRKADFQDNLPVIELIDFSSLSIFNLLDQWCSVAAPDESSFITKLRYNHKKHPKFPQSNLNLPSSFFLISHTPKDVEYAVAGFRQKNKDLLREQIINCMRKSTLGNLQALFAQVKEEEGPIDPRAHRVRKFLSSKFRKEMNELVDNLLSKSELHFVRCIKSNDQKIGMKFQQELVVSQITYLGIMDTIRTKKMGYCVKLTYDTLDQRFQWLVRYHFSSPAFPHEIRKALQTFLPRYSEAQILFGKEKVFFKDYAYTVLTHKYTSYLKDLCHKCHRITSLLVLNRYLNIKQRKAKCISIINGYFLSLFTARAKNRKLKSIRRVQEYIRRYLQQQRRFRRQHNILTLQNYIRRIIDNEDRVIRLKAGQKIINFLRSIVIRKKQQSKKIAQMIVLFDLMPLAFNKVSRNRARKIQAYISTFGIHIVQKRQIAIANLNTKKFLEAKSFCIISTYLHSYTQALNYSIIMKKLLRLQAYLRGWLLRRQYKNFKNAAIVIQRATRKYILERKKAKQLFFKSFQFYEAKVKSQNFRIQQFLYNGKETQNDTIDLLYQNYLSRFKEKMSLMYYIVDFECFVDLEVAYPNNSWVLNYFEVIKESFNRDSPIQALHVAETFTLAATTNKLYVWGMNDNYLTLQNIQTLKLRAQPHQIRIIDQVVQIDYEQAKPPVTYNYQTVNRKFVLEGGKVSELFWDARKLTIDLERIVEMSCGSSHVIMRALSKRVYTFGSGKKGQLGHGNLSSYDKPKQVLLPDIKIYYPIQVVAGFYFSAMLMSNRRIYWFGTNSTIQAVVAPTVCDLKIKSKFLGSNEMTVVRLSCSWSRTMSVMGVTLLSYNQRLQNKINLRNKIIDVLIQKWHQKGIDSINPPVIPSVSDNLENCHVKLPKIKTNIEPQGKRIIKEMQEKVKSLEIDNKKDLGDISFAEDTKKSIFK